MKKILVTVAIASMALSSALAQGTIFAINGAAPLNITTNDGAGNVGSTAGARTYYYGLFISPTVMTSTNPVASGWTFTGTYMTNLSNGAISGGAAAAVAGWANNTTYYFMVAGWSANIAGANWNNVLSSGSVANGVSTVAGDYFGVSTVGFGQPGGGSPALPVFHIFGTGAGQIQGFTLTTATAPVPEPTTLALAGLSGASLLLFRRRK